MLPPLDDRTELQSEEPWGGLDDSTSARTNLADHTTTQSLDTGQFDVRVGMRIGEYQIERKIGEGGMGVVYAAVHPLIGKRAAIKILKKDLCRDPMQVGRFIDEARVVNEIGHPNIVNVFAFGEMPDGRRYFVMDWLDGESLRARIARGSVSLVEAGAIVRPLARALQAAHDKGVIHRDLKPDNVFLVHVPDELPTVKLLDFGIAKLARREQHVDRTATGAIIGTPQYIAPEQAKGYAIDHRADTYALGGILFELLTRRSPFVADNAMEMVAKHLMEAPVAPSTLTPGLPPEVDALVLRMLAKTPDERPSLREITQVLREHASSPGRDSAPGSRRALTFSEPSRPDAVSLSAGPLLHVRASTEPATPFARTSMQVAAAEPMPPPSPWTPKRLALLAAPVLVLIALAAVKVASSGAKANEVKAEPIAQPRVEPAAAPPAVVEQPPAVEPTVDEVQPASPEPAPPKPVRREAARSVEARPAPKPRGKLELVVTNRTPRTQILIDGAPYDPKAMLTVGAHVLEIRSPNLAKPIRTSVAIRKGEVTSKTIALPAATRAR